MLGVMLLILASELWSASGEDDFFSVARTMPLVAAQKSALLDYGGVRLPHDGLHTLDAKSSNALVDGVQGIFYAKAISI